MIPISLTSPPRLRGILVPLDGSDLAEQALAVGVARARRSDATLHLVSVQEPYPALALPPEVPIPTADLERQALAERRQYLETLATAARASLQAPVLVTVLAGDAATALAGYVESHEVDLVVMTTHGRTGLSRLWLGSVADRLLRRLAVPVLLLHAGEAPQATEVRHLVVALDGDIEEPVFDAIVALGARPGVTRCILTRVVPGSHPGPQRTEQLVEQARAYLARLAEPMAAAGWDVDWQVVVGRGIASQILALAEASGADCIAVGTHGLRGVERLLLGSVADKIVRGSRVPVLIAPVRRPAEPVEAHAPAAAAQPIGLAAALTVA
jgi:nucleotide-binding universal stress UspA family protein